MNTQRYIDGLIRSLMFVFGMFGLIGLAVTPIFMIMTYIPPSLLGASLMIGWMLILIAIAASPFFMKD